MGAETVANITISVTDGEFVSRIVPIGGVEANDPPTITAIPERINAVGRMLLSLLSLETPMMRPPAC